MLILAGGTQSQEAPTLMHTPLNAKTTMTTISSVFVAVADWRHSPVEQFLPISGKEGESRLKTVYINDANGKATSYRGCYIAHLSMHLRLYIYIYLFGPLTCTLTLKMW